METCHECFKELPNGKFKFFKGTPYCIPHFKQKQKEHSEVRAKGTIRIITIETCYDCPHDDHTGGFTPGGADSCCGHDDIVDKYDGMHTKSNDGVIPNWCPLKIK